MSANRIDPSETNYANGELIKRLLALSWRYKGDCLLVIGLQLVLLTMGLAGLGFAGIGVDVIHHEVVPDTEPPRWPFGLSPPDSWSATAVIGLVSGLVLSLALIRAVLNYKYQMSVAKLVQQKIVPNLRGQVYEKLQKLDFRFFDANASGSIINRVTSDVQNVRIFVDGVLVQALIMIISLVVFLIFMMSIHFSLTLACLATTPLLWVASVMFSRRARPAFVKNRELIDEMVRALAESVQGVFAVKGFGREKEERTKFFDSSNLVRDHMRSIFILVSSFGPSVNMLTHVNITVLLAYGGYLVYNKELALGTGIVVFSGLLQQFSNQVSNISGLANKVQRSLTGARRVFEILDTPVAIASSPDAVSMEKSRGSVEFRHVSFGYSKDEYVLEDVSFAVEPGHIVAVVGATGAGKSALLSLIPRFYDPDKGEVYIDGVDAKRLKLEDLRRNIGIVFQESFMFSNTIASNIAFGNPWADRERIEKAAKLASAHEFILEMPQGYDSVLGEAGSNLSGGQRQRLAIARALLLEPSILILDDPTAAIDAGTEDEILRAMDNAMKGRTTFVVAHRMSTLRRSDYVIVLDNGCVVQTGSHDELLSSRGLYRNLANLQVVDDTRSRDQILNSAP